MTAAKRGRGRPANPPGERTQVRGVRLSEDDWAWLAGHGAGVTATVRELVLLARVSEATGLPVHPKAKTTTV